jgi:phosphoglycerate dehydrogenase-like enzyme
MRTINVVVTSNVGQECLELISGVAGVNLRSVSDLLHDKLKGDEAAGAEFDAELARAEVIYGLRLPQDVLRKAPSLKWVQVMSAGVEHFLDADMRESPVVLTNASGINALPIAEFVTGLMLMFVKESSLCFEMKQNRKWERVSPVLLRSKTVGIIGLGNIGKEVARLSKVFGMRVIATRRSAREEGRARNVDLILPTSRLNELLAESDFVVVAAPLTVETRGLIGEEELRTMKPTARLINVARGAIVDEQSLTRALEEKWIAGAGLDVFATEPLPHDSPLWTLPNVILSPHISGGREDYVLAATMLFVENLRRYRDGRRLMNVVDKGRGY